MVSREFLVSSDCLGEVGRGDGTGAGYREGRLCPVRIRLGGAPVDPEALLCSLEKEDSFSHGLHAQLPGIAVMYGYFKNQILYCHLPEVGLSQYSDTCASVSTQTPRPACTRAQARQGCSAL